MTVGAVNNMLKEIDIDGRWTVQGRFVRVCLARRWTWW